MGIFNEFRGWRKKRKLNNIDMSFQSGDWKKLVKHASDSEDEVQEAAVSCLGDSRFIDEPRVKEALVDALSRGSSDVQLKAAWILRDIPRESFSQEQCKKITDVLSHLLFNEQCGRLCEAAGEALHAWDWKPQNDYQKACLNIITHGSIKERDVKALGQDASRVLLNALDVEEIEGGLLDIGEHLGRVKDRQAIPRLIKHLFRIHHSATAAAYALGEMGATEALEHLSKLTDDSNHRTAEAARQAIRKIREKR